MRPALRIFWCCVLFFCAVMTVNAQQSPHEPLSIACTDCHSTESWSELAVPMRFTHSSTGFSLVGQHANTACVRCHTTKKFAGTPADCYTCHRNDFTIAAEPNHEIGRFSHECLSCHTVNAWKPSIFLHAKTNFPLIGAHISVSCDQCHGNDVYTGLTRDCYVCHQKDFLSVSTPNHTAAQFPHDCLNCHSMTAWTPSTFVHSQIRDLLDGAHRSLDCSSCHSRGIFKGTPQDCFSCHQKDYAAVQFPNHIQGQLDHNCTSCHTNISWKPSTFDHTTTQFVLLGAHRTAQCSSCHTSGRFTGLSMECYPCHTKAYTEISSPNHVSGQFDRNCKTCHTENAWKPSFFSHSKTSFTLLGAHRSVPCSSCHIDERYSGTTQDCFSCHGKDFLQAKSPNHVSAHFGHDCSSCHTMDSWTPSTFDHARTQFALTGAHQVLSCASCHKNGRFIGVSTDCFSCHQQQFFAVTAPNHQQAQFDHNCRLCHTVNGWKPSTFDHEKTVFPLSGAHRTTDCLFCHKNGQFSGTPSDCWSCHAADFTSVTDPNHIAGNFDHLCSTCHTTLGWSPAGYDHARTRFPLTGRHLSLLCAQCHGDGKYAGTSMVCFDCHSQDYNAATNPNHAVAKYPTDCAGCHTASGWVPSTFNHTPYFPISAGTKHRPGRWNLCSDCHTNPSNFKVFSCINCHEHNKTSTDDEHRGISGYSYDSAACYRCHPTGNG